jgi:hypothetical protein
MPADQPKIPGTAVQLSTSITLRLLPNDIDPKNVTADVITQAKTIGAIIQFSEENNRPAEPRYEIDADNPGDIVEQVPQLVSRNLTIERAVLYENDILEAFGVTGGDLINQHRPFAIVKVEKVPEGSKDSKGNSVTQKITLFTGCWFTSNPKAYNVGARDVRVIQSVGVAYAKRRVIRTTA